jgi:hypothetical protein
MNILLLCDRKNAGLESPIFAALYDLLTKAGHVIESITLDQTVMQNCVGCFGCWVKTPGKCVITGDAANGIAEKEIRSDAIIFLSEIVYGGFSADIKTLLERSIQNILPFFETYKGEMHHEVRYERFPIWIAIGCGEVSDGEAQTFVRLADRNALNLRPKRHMALVIKDEKELLRNKQRLLSTLTAEGKTVKTAEAEDVKTGKAETDKIKEAVAKSAAIRLAPVFADDADIPKTKAAAS